MDKLDQIQSKIYEIRGQKVMLDFDLAELYGIETRVLKQAVRRNSARFEGEDFINAAYLQLLKRFPTKQDLIYWERQSDYKEKLIVTIVNSMEFIRLRIRVLNMPYQIDIRNNKLKRKLYGDTAEWLQKQWYFKLYMSCPSGIKRIAKKVINIL